MRIILLLAVSLLMAFSGIAFANTDVELIEVIFNVGLFSEFDANGGTGGDGLQHMEGVSGAYVYSDGMTNVRTFNNTSVSLDVWGMNDYSSGGVAGAYFSDGNWSVTLFDDQSNSVLSISGTVDWYEELETDTNAVDGRGIVSILPSTVHVDHGYWGQNARWASNNNKSGIQTKISNITPLPLTDYQSDWQSTNVRLLIWADSSQIPEPLTLVFLSSGLLFVRRRKR